MPAEGVYIAEHIRLGERRIIKRLDRQDRFYDIRVREADILKRLHHPGIPRLYDVEEDDRYTYVIKEYIEGTIIKRDLIDLDEDLIISILSQLCDIIHYLHEQSPSVYYPDLKPENIIYTSASHKISLIDFGAVFFGQESQPGPVFGNKDFTAPEVREKGMICDKCEVYSIGALAYYMLTGETTFGSGKISLALNRRLNTAIFKCLQTKLSARPSLEELSRMLGRSRKKSAHIVKGDKDLFPHGVTIGLIGVHPGAGVTHVGLLLSRYAAKAAGGKIAFVEYNDHGDMVRLIEENKEVKNVVMIPNADAEVLTRALSEGYDAYIIDFGTDLGQLSGEFRRCDIKIAVTHLSAWKQNILNEFCSKKEEFYRQEKWHFIFNLTPKAEARDRIPVNAANGHYLGFQSISGHLSDETSKILEELLRNKC